MTAARHDPRHVGVCVEELEYLERWSPPASLLPPMSRQDNDFTEPAAGMRRLFRVRGVTRRPQRAGVSPPQGPEDPPTVALLTGACRLRTPIVFALGDRGDGLHLGFGVWSLSGIKPGELDARRDAVVGALNALYPVVDVDLEADTELPRHEAWASAVGVPAGLPSTVDDEVNVVDRLVRAMAGRAWSVLIVAQPAGRKLIKDKRAEILEEIRRAEADPQGRQNPLIENYVELLTVQLKAFNEAAVAGGWRVATYLGAGEADLPRLSTVWMSLFSGPGALPDPVRVVGPDPHAGQWAAAWAMPDLAAPPGSPSRYRHPSRHQSLLTSRQLAQCVQLPQSETGGFTVSTRAHFDVVRDAPAEPAFGLGEIVAPGAPAYRVAVNDLTRHVFAAGMTGSGKTTTLRHILSQVDVPFLVLEPAKKEYRSLLAHARFTGRMRVFTVGDETVAPLRLNPLQVPPGASISMHMDLLKSLFVASFGMWSPLPQILERALHESYTACGWDTTHDGNPRVPGGERPAAAFPTLSALHARVERIIGSLGYSGEVVSNMRAALSTRIRALCIGGKGRLLDTTETVDPAALFEHPTVLELEGMGDDDDKAFVMGLVLIQLAAYRRSHPSSGLKHLLVVEEAHRLLSNVAGADPALQGNPRGKAVEAFTNLLAEIRELGQGIVISDQVPTRLAPDVVKNTNLKIAHRMVAADDRAVLGASMAMSEAQQRDLATLGQGFAAVFSEGDDAPILVRIGNTGAAPKVTTAEVRQAMAAHLPAARGPGGLATTAAQALVADPDLHDALVQVVLSTVDDESACPRLWPGIAELVKARRPAYTDAGEVTAALVTVFAADLAGRWSAEYGWPVAGTEEFKSAVCGLLSGEGPDSAARLRKLLRRVDDPFPRCTAICGPAPGACLYRGASSQALAAGRLAARWASVTQAEAVTGQWEQRQATAHYAARVFLEPRHNPQHDLAAACFLQIGLTRHSPLTVAVIRHHLNDLAATPPGVDNG